MVLNLSPVKIEGIDEKEARQIEELIDVYQYHEGKNRTKDEYYEGKISLNSVNLGIALPDGMSRLEIGCSWGAKTVDVLAARSRFDGFVSANGTEQEEIRDIVSANNLTYEYMKACRDELKYGCTFVTLSADAKMKCRIRFHSPRTAAALWSGEKGRIECGFAIIDTVKDESKRGTYQPSLINFYTDDAIWILRRDFGDYWIAEKKPHKMGRPLMEPLIWNATSDKPLGRSRIKEPIRRLIDGYIRTLANASIGLEFATSPQKYLLGLTDEQYDEVTKNKFKQYAGMMLAATTNPDTGEEPKYGQLQQGTLAPHVEMIRILATQFSAATGLSVIDTGVINEANPTSSDAILAQNQTLVAMAEQLNAGNGNTLRTIAQMALAIAKNKALDDLTDEEKDVIAHFKNPAMPSVAATADAAIKIASARENFASTDVFVEMVGFDQADIRRIKSEEQRERGLQLLTEIETDEAEENETLENIEEETEE